MHRFIIGWVLRLTPAYVRSLDTDSATIDSSVTSLRACIIAPLTKTFTPYRTDLNVLDEIFTPHVIQLRAPLNPSVRYYRGSRWAIIRTIAKNVSTQFPLGIFRKDFSVCNV